MALGSDRDVRRRARARLGRRRAPRGGGGILTRIRATYRVQLNPAFTFDDAARIVPYLAQLGISHLYCSPVLQAAPGSAHGYDVVDPTRLSDDLGGRGGFDRLGEALAAHDMAMIVDIVPNHMALAGAANAWWWDLLEDGPASRYARHFDIDWTPAPGSTVASVLMPVLGDHYGRILEAGGLRLERRGGSFVVVYEEHEVPLSLPTLAPLLAEVASAVGSDELAALATGMRDLDGIAEPDVRHDRREELRAGLRTLTAEDAGVAVAIDTELASLGADPDRLDDLLVGQHHRLAHWRIVSEELDFRRFFDVTTLVGVRVEDPVVFEDTHRCILELVHAGRIAGLRIDHIDGLRDPAGYLERLHDAAPDTTVLVEKILAGDEALPAAWPVAGTTGYEFLHRVDEVLLDPAGVAALEADAVEHVGDGSYEDDCRAARLRVAGVELAPEVERLVDLLAEVCRHRRRHRDHTRRELRTTLREVLASMRVYRTYVVPGRPASEEDRRRVCEAMDHVRAVRPDADGELLDLLTAVLLLDESGPVEEQLAMRFQQVSGPVMAKGFEDTAFYRRVALLSRNEVGGEPDEVGDAVAAFHEHNRRTAASHPATMRTLSTHDTKRSADVRARLQLLSELAEPWLDAVAGWRDANDRHWRGHRPDRRSELVLYQSLLGAWPVEEERLQHMLLKSMREAKLETSWRDPNVDHEESVARFTTAVLADEGFRRSFESFLTDHDIVARGRRNSLVQVALALTSPGFVDIYQGGEGWDLSLVDPDNRRPVDHERHAAVLDALRTDGLAAVARFDDDGAAKQWLLHRVLQHRRQAPHRFESDRYDVLVAEGAKADHALAFARDGLAVVVPRLLVGLGDDWAGTTIDLPAGSWRDVVSDAGPWSGRVALADLLATFAVAVLDRQED